MTTPEGEPVTTTARLPVDFIDVVDHHDAVDRLKLLNRGSGFVITIERTKQDRNALKQTRKVFLRCWKSRPYKSTSAGHRKSSTRSTECPWRASLTRQDGGWRVEVKHMEHNHALDASSPVPTVARRQKPQAPLRALASMAPYPMQGVIAPPPAQSHGMPFTPQPFAHLPPFPQSSLGVAPFQPLGTGFAMAMPEYRSTTPPGSPPRSAAARLQPAAAMPPSAGLRGRQRRGGFSVLAEIKRIEVPIHQRLVLRARDLFRPEPPAYLVYNDEFNDILGENPDLKIAYEDTVPFAHGAAVFSPQRDIVLMASPPFLPVGKYEKSVMISKLSRKEDGCWRRDEVLTLAVLISGGTNYNEGFLFCAQGDYRDSGGLVHMVADYPHTTTVMLNNYLGRRFNSINDAVVHSDGSIWFTDPIYGFEQGLRPKPELPNQVYRFDPETGDVRVVADGFGRPKGICFSPSEKTLYITDTDTLHGDGSIDPTRPAIIYAYDVVEKRNSKWLVNRRVFAMPDTGFPDGIKCDMVGNVYAGCGDGLNVWNSGGVLIGKVLIPGGVTNFCFGNSGEIFMLNETRFWILTVSDTVQGALPGRVHQDNAPEREDTVDSMESLFGGEDNTG